MSIYIESDSLRKEYNDWYKLFAWGDGTDAEKATIARAIQILDEQPTADVVEVVRCEDCRYWDNRFDVMVCNLTDGMKGASDYCSYAERREDE